MIVVAELLRNGAIDAAALASIARRLNHADLADMADRISALPISNAFDDPDQIRAGMHIVGGGNEDG